MKSYSELESKCSLSFNGFGPYWHLWTPENHPVFLPGKDTFKAAMSILAICARLIPEVRIITFQLMTNHLHLTFAGSKEDGMRLFNLFIRYLSKYLKAQGIQADLSFK